MHVVDQPRNADTVHLKVAVFSKSIILRCLSARFPWITLCAEFIDNSGSACVQLFYNVENCAEQLEIYSLCSVARKTFMLRLVIGMLASSKCCLSCCSG
jgi:hypothetical protein